MAVDARARRVWEDGGGGARMTPGMATIAGGEELR